MSILNEVRAPTIESSAMSRRTKNMLYKIGFKHDDTPEKLVQYPVKYFARQKEFGPKTITDLYQWLESHELKLNYN